MAAKWVLAAALAAMAAGEAMAGGFVAVDGGGAATSVSAAAPPVSLRRLELYRELLPREGRGVAVPVQGGGTLSTIEWRREAVVRARTRTGAPLSAAELAALRDSQVRCQRGTPTNLREMTGRNLTWELRYDCTWLQGVAGQ